jgi:hypothetical protein
MFTKLSFVTVYEQECGLYSYTQNNMTNNQWYERFNTKIDVKKAIGVTRQHEVLLEHVASEREGDAHGNKPKFKDLAETIQEEIRVEAK